MEIFPYYFINTLKDLVATLHVVSKRLALSEQNQTQNTDLPLLLIFPHIHYIIVNTMRYGRNRWCGIEVCLSVKEQ
jgi:hypothetical protein